MNVTCKSSGVEWFKEGQVYTIDGKYIHDHYGTEWRVVESKLTPGAFSVYSMLGHNIATMVFEK